MKVLEGFNWLHANRIIWALLGEETGVNYPGTDIPVATSFGGVQGLDANTPVGFVKHHYKTFPLRNYVHDTRFVVKVRYGDSAVAGHTQMAIDTGALIKIDLYQVSPLTAPSQAPVDEALTKGQIVFQEKIQPVLVLSVIIICPFSESFSRKPIPCMNSSFEVINTEVAHPSVGQVTTKEVICFPNGISIKDVEHGSDLVDLQKILQGFITYVSEVLG